MNKAEFLNQYADSYFLFSNYYKFSFNFTGETIDGKPVLLLMGGDSDDIYRVDLSHEETLKNLVEKFGDIEIIVNNETLS